MHVRHLDSAVHQHDRHQTRSRGAGRPDIVEAPAPAPAEDERASSDSARTSAEPRDLRCRRPARDEERVGSGSGVSVVNENALAAW